MPEIGDFAIVHKQTQFAPLVNHYKTMKIKIDAAEMPQSPLHDAGKTYCFPHIIAQQTMTTNDMVEHIQKVCTLTRIDCNAVIEAMSSYITSAIVSGNQVHINGLGTFGPALSFADPSKKSILQTPADVRLTDVNFRAEAKLLNHLRHTMKYERKEAMRSSNISIGTIVLELQKFYAVHHELTARQFESMFSLKRTRANTILNTLTRQNKLQRRAIGRTYVYTAGPTLDGLQKG